MKSVETGIFLDDFEVEAKTHIEKIESAFLNAYALTDNPELMNKVFRAAHSIKGTATFFSLGKIVAVSHELESVFLQIKNGNLKISGKIVDIVLQSIDCLKDLVGNVHDDDAINVGQLIETLMKYSGTQKQYGETHLPFDFSDIKTEAILKTAVRYGQKIYFININFNKSLKKFYEHPQKLIENILSAGMIVETHITGKRDKESLIIKDSGIDLISDKITEVLTGHSTLNLKFLVSSVLGFDIFPLAVDLDKKHIHLLDKNSIFKSERVLGADNGQVYIKSPEQESSSSIRLDISVINNLIDFANEMILTRNRLFSTLSGYEKSIPGLAPVLFDVNRLTSEIQEKIMFTRMQPISVIFNKFPRIIHDTAKALGKDITVRIFKDDVVLDKFLLEALADPITQIVKNSAGHGLESTEQRAILGKPESGLITLTSYTRDSFAIIEITDDGMGIDTETLKQKALELGIVTEEALLFMPESEVFDLVFEPGISTSREISNLSGRGFGMNIVKTNIEKLGGSIEIESELGKGTVIRLIMPLTLSVVRALIVTIDSIEYAVPEMNIERIVRIKNETTAKRIEKVNNSLVLVFNGRIIPIISIREIETKAKDMEPLSPDEILERSGRMGIVKCLILKAGAKNFALLIDNALDTEQILVKPLPVFFQNFPCYSNVTVLGNGKAIPILNAEGIMRYMNIDDIEKEAALVLSAEIKNEKEDIEQEMNEKQIIVFNCSGPEYFAVEIEDISRIETIDSNDIQESDSGHFVNIADKTIRVIRPEDLAPFKKQDYIERKLYLLALKNCAAPLGLLARKVLDKFEDNFLIDSDQFNSDFIFGTSVYNDKVIIFLNPAAITEDIENNKVNRKFPKKAGII